MSTIDFQNGIIVGSVLDGVKTEKNIYNFGIKTNTVAQIPELNSLANVIKTKTIAELKV